MSEFGELGHPVFDADNHYYEALDAFTRHLDPALGSRVIQWSEINGRRYHVIGGRVSRAVTNPTFDPVALPGAMYDYFRGNPDGRNPMEFLSRREPVRPAYREPEARLAALDGQGMAGCLLFPTLGMIYEEPLAHDPEAVCHLFRAFNRWLVEDWTFDYQDRIFAAPYLTLADPAWAVEELAWALDHGARTVVMRPAAPTTALGRRNPFDPMFDGFWGLADEAGITVVVHAADSGGLVQRLCRRRVRRHLHRGVEALHQVVRHRAGHPRLPAHAHLREPSRAVPQPADRVGGERGRVPARPDQEDPIDGQQDARLLEARPRRDAAAPRLDQSVLGGRRLPGGRVHRRRPGHLRIGLAPHRSPSRAARLCGRAQEIRRRRHAGRSSTTTSRS